MVSFKDFTKKRQRNGSFQELCQKTSMQWQLSRVLTENVNAMVAFKCFSQYLELKQYVNATS